MNHKAILRNTKVRRSNVAPKEQKSVIYTLIYKEKKNNIILEMLENQAIKGANWRSDKNSSSS